MDMLPTQRHSQILENMKNGDSPVNLHFPHEESPSSFSSLGKHTTMDAAWKDLTQSIVYFRGQPIGTVAAMDKSQGALNYDQVFMMDFIPSALAFIMKGEESIVKSFLLETARLQSWKKMLDLFQLGQGVMLASFKVHHCNQTKETESLQANFCETVIGRVAPVDSGLWWIVFLHAYTKLTGENSLGESPDCQKVMRLILSLYLYEDFDMPPTLLCANGCCMIDRRMSVYGYPIELQALFFMALRCALHLLKQDTEDDFVYRITKRSKALSYHLHNSYWLDFRRLNDICCYKTEECSHAALNKFNVIPKLIPDFIFDIMPDHGGFSIGNSPARMDFRWFCLGNFIAIFPSLATTERSAAIMDLVEERWEDLIGEVPLKMCFPAMEDHEWRIVTGCDPKITRWVYHNGGSWPESSTTSGTWSSSSGDGRFQLSHIAASVPPAQQHHHMSAGQDGGGRPGGGGDGRGPPGGGEGGGGAGGGPPRGGGRGGGNGPPAPIVMCDNCHVRVATIQFTREGRFHHPRCVHCIPVSLLTEHVRPAGEWLLRGVIQEGRFIRHAYVKRSDTNRIEAVVLFHVYDMRPVLPEVWRPSRCVTYTRWCWIGSGRH